MLRLRRLDHLLLALALAIGLVTHAAQAASMDSTMSMAASAMQICDHGDCDGRDPEPCKSVGVCSLPCNGTIGLPVTTTAFDAPSDAAAPFPASRMGAGWSAPPDPYPPRPFVLS